MFDRFIPTNRARHAKPFRYLEAEVNGILINTWRVAILNTDGVESGKSDMVVVLTKTRMKENNSNPKTQDMPCSQIQFTRICSPIWSTFVSFIPFKEQSFLTVVLLRFAIKESVSPRLIVYRDLPPVFVL